LNADINYLGHLNVLEAVRNYSPKAKILFPGSRLQFGEIEKMPVSEDHPLRPKTPYALNKTIEFVPWPKNYLNVETGNYITDITKIKKVLGWKPRTTLAERIALTLDYYKRYQNFYWN